MLVHVRRSNVPGLVNTRGAPARRTATRSRSMCNWPRRAKHGTFGRPVRWGLFASRWTVREESAARTVAALTRVDAQFHDPANPEAVSIRPVLPHLRCGMCRGRPQLPRAPLEGREQPARQGVEGRLTVSLPSSAPQPRWTSNRRAACRETRPSKVRLYGTPAKSYRA